MPDLKQRQPDFSHSGWSKDGARLKATQDSTSEWREVGAQVTWLSQCRPLLGYAAAKMPLHNQYMGGMYAYICCRITGGSLPYCQPKPVAHNVARAGLIPTDRTVDLNVN